jgi:hypothetical protein
VIYFKLFLLHYRESFRCGAFFAGKNFKDKPFQKLFIVPKRFPINTTYTNPDQDGTERYSPDASCPIKHPYGTAEYTPVHNDTCYFLVIFVY